MNIFFHQLLFVLLNIYLPQNHVENCSSYMGELLPIRFQEHVQVIDLNLVTVSWYQSRKHRI
jgi:hypothetical protein